MKDELLETKQPKTVSGPIIVAMLDALEPLACQLGVKLALYETKPFTLELKMFARPKEAVPSFLKKQLALIKKINKIHDAPYKKGEDWAAFMKRADGMMDQIEALMPKSGPVGVPVYFPAGDGHAVYLITAVLGNRVQVEHIRVGDAWSWAGVGVDDTISLDTAEKAARRTREPLFAKLKPCL